MSDTERVRSPTVSEGYRQDALFQKASTQPQGSPR